MYMTVTYDQLKVESWHNNRFCVDYFCMKFTLMWREAQVKWSRACAETTVVELCVRPLIVLLQNQKLKSNNLLASRLND